MGMVCQKLYTYKIKSGSCKNAVPGMSEYLNNSGRGQGKDSAKYCNMLKLFVKILKHLS